jgi:hypothetical protein
MTATPHPSQTSPTPTVRELILELAAAEDAVRECRRLGPPEQRDAAIRRRGRLVRELRRRHCEGP